MQYLQIKESQPNSQLMRMTSVHHRLRGTCEQCVDVHMSLCVCIDCSQLLNINLKVKGMELFDIHAGCCTLCLVLKPNPRCWVIMAATISPFLSPMLCMHTNAYDMF